MGSWGPSGGGSGGVAPSLALPFTQRLQAGDGAGPLRGGGDGAHPDCGPGRSPSLHPVTCKCLMTAARTLETGTDLEEVAP